MQWWVAALLVAAVALASASLPSSRAYGQEPAATPWPAPADAQPTVVLPSVVPPSLVLPPDPPLAYRERLLGEINVLRAQAGLAALAPAPPDVHAALDAYLQDVAPRVLAAGRCASDVLDEVAPAWDYVAARGYLAEPRGYLLVCPTTELYWPTTVVSQTWAATPGPREYLGDREIDTLACGLFGLQSDRLAYRAIACLTYSVG